MRVQNSTELNEWLFKFYCLLASFMKNMVDAMGEESCQTRALDLHNVAPPIVFLPSMDSSHLLRNRKTAVVQRNSLSHGHGRRSKLVTQIEVKKFLSFDGSSPYVV